MGGRVKGGGKRDGLDWEKGDGLRLGKRGR